MQLLNPSAGAASSAAPAGNYSPAMQQSFQLPQQTRSNIDNVMNDPTGGLPQLNIPPAPAMAAPPAASAQSGNLSANPMMTMRDQLNKIALLQGAVKGDITPAINAIYKTPTPLRQNAGYVDEMGVVHPGGQAPEGYTYNPQTGKLEQMTGAQEALNAVAANKAAVGKAFTPAQPRIGPNGIEVVPTGSELPQLYPSGALPYGARSPFPEQNPQFHGVSPDQVPASLRALPDTGQQSLPQMSIGNQSKLSPTQQSEGAGRGEVLAKEYGNIASAADNAVAQAGRTAEMRKLVPHIPFGITAPMRQTLAQYALDIPGIGPTLANSVVRDASNSVPAMQVFNKMASQMVIEQSKQLGTREAASVIQMVANANPNVSWTRPAAETVLDYLDGSNKWALDRQQAAKEWVSSHNNSLSGFLEDWNKSHPLTDYIPPLEHIRSAIQTGTVPEKSDAKSAPAQGKTVVRTGTLNGKKVVQYSDGTTGYAQ
jgi:hypothetical protein